MPPDVDPNLDPNVALGTAAEPPAAPAHAADALPAGSGADAVSKAAATESGEAKAAADKPQAPAAAAPAIPEPEPSLLSKKPEPAKPAEAADAEAKKPEPAEAAKPAEAAPPEVPKPPEPVEYDYVLPETIKLDDALKTEVHKALDDFRANPKGGAQALFDLHATQMQEFANQTLANQFATFAKTRESWRKELMADPELGGAGFNTSQGAIARMRDQLVSTAKPGSEQFKKDWADFESFVKVTGAGDHPVFHRILHNAARWLDEPQAADAPAGIQPTKNNGKNPRRSGLYSEESRQKMNG